MCLDELAIWFHLNFDIYRRELLSTRDANGEFLDPYTRRLWELRHDADQMELEREQAVMRRR